MNRLPISQSIFFAMATQRRKFTDEQKLEILRQADKMGVTAVMRSHSLSYSVLARWKERFLKGDMTKEEIMIQNKARFELKQFIDENTRLKKIIAEQALELERKDEELRKNNPLYGKR
jgi:putative transposase